MKADIDINLNDYVKKLLSCSADALIKAKHVDLILGRLKGIIEEDSETYFLVQTCRDNYVLIETACYGDKLKVSKDGPIMTVTLKNSETSTEISTIADVLFVISGSGHFKDGSLKGYKYFELNSFQQVHGVISSSLQDKSDL